MSFFSFYFTFHFISLCGRIIYLTIFLIICFVSFKILIFRCLFLLNSFMTEVSIIKNQSVDLHSKSMGWFIYAKGVRYERINKKLIFVQDDSFKEFISIKQFLVQNLKFFCCA